MEAIKSRQTIPRASLLFTIVTVILVTSIVTLLAANAPQAISYQGHLVNSSGEPIDSAVTITFCIYDLPENGTIIWSETHTGVNVTDGWFNLTLGSINPLPDTVFATAERYLGMTLAGSIELTPRTRLVSTGYAHRVSTIGGAESGCLSGLVEIVPEEAKDGRLTDPALIVRGNDADSVVISPVDDITIYSTNDAGDQTILVTSEAQGGAMLVSATDVAKGILRTIEISPGDSIVLRAAGSSGEDLVLITADPSGGVMYVSATDVAKGVARTVSISPRDSIVLSATESNGDQVILITANPTGGAMYVTATDVAKGTQRTIEISPRDSVVLRATENNGDEVILITSNPSGGAVLVSATDVAKSDPKAIVSTVVLNRDGVFVLSADQSDTSIALTVSGDIVGEGQLTAGDDNSAGGTEASISGGHDNDASELRSFIGGGGYNVASASYAAVAGGYGNQGTGQYTFIGGGGGGEYVNHARDSLCVVGGGINNYSGLPGEAGATSGGGKWNFTYDMHSTVCGGESNNCSDDYGTIVGGSQNLTGLYAFCGGAFANSLNWEYATVGGGKFNYIASGPYATAYGGRQNSARDTAAFTGAGRRNSSQEPYGVITGGSFNWNLGRCSVIGGGGGYTDADSGRVYGDFSVIPGGTFNRIEGDYSFAAGRRTVVDSTHDGTFLWADSNDVPFNSAAAAEFAARATGGVRFVTAIDGSGNPTAGVILASGGGSWSSISDREAKENFEAIDFELLLEKLAQLEVSTWNYKTQDESIRHIGPTAQDFSSAFAVGEDDKHITTIDGIGVALSAIKGLCLHRQELLEKVAKHEHLKKRVEELEKLVEELLTKGGGEL
jgi:hypothetical protein